MNQEILNAIKKAKEQKIRPNDVYKDNHLRKTLKGIDNRGEEIWGYEYTPELFVKSDVSGMMCRHYILVDGFIFHPSEIDRAKVNKKTGEIKVDFVKIKVVQPGERNKTVKSMDRALYEATSWIYSTAKKIKENETVTLVSGDTEISMTRNEWETIRRKHYSWNNGPSFYELYEIINSK